MRISRLQVVSGLLLIFGMVSGCAKDREAIVTGKWQTSQVPSRAAAFQAAADKRSGATTDPAAVARALGSTSLDLRKDKTFALDWQGKQLSGTWELSKDTGQVELKLASLPGQQPFEAGSWAAYLSQDNSKLQLYTTTPELAEKVKKDAGPLSDGIVLEKQTK